LIILVERPDGCRETRRLTILENGCAVLKVGATFLKMMAPVLKSRRHLE
jgi:hypothetical protein